MKLIQLQSFLKHHMHNTINPVTGYRQFQECNAMVIEGESGIGKTSAMMYHIEENLRGFVKEEAAAGLHGPEMKEQVGKYIRFQADNKEVPVKLADEVEGFIAREAASRIAFVPMGTMDDVAATQGMAAKVTNPDTGREELEYLHPKKYNFLWDKPHLPKVLFIDELNRVDTIKLMNSIQTQLDSGDRQRIGIFNTVVFGTQNPSTSNEYTGTEEADKALEYRVIKLTLELGKDDFEYLAQFRNWEDPVVDARNFMVEDERKNEEGAVNTPRLMEQCSLALKRYHEKPHEIPQELLIGCAAGDKQYGDCVWKAANGKLFKLLSLEEMKKMSAEGFRNDLKIAQIIASFRKVIREHKDLAMNKPGSKKALEDLGVVLTKLPDSAMAAIHTRFSTLSILATIWANNKDIATKIMKIKSGK